MKKNIAILGSTGSIGKQALEVIERNPDKFVVDVLTANSNANLLIEQSLKFKPNAVVIRDKNHYKYVSENLLPHNIKVFAGEESISQIVEMESINIVLNALVGYSGFKPTINAINSGKHIALANKETLVVGGEIITKLALEKGVYILPVDSEHSAIFQCLIGESLKSIEKIYLTASGGPFRNKTNKYLQNVTKAEALKHPNWNMGDKITIDSATLLNKGLEVIEAKWLFGLKPEQIEVIVHSQSIIHSIVQFKDSSMKAQMGLPDMRIPIQYALGFPERLDSDYPRFNFLNYPELTFESPDLEKFRSLKLAYIALEKAGNMPCILNAANEIAVEAFLNDKISFLQIPDIIEKCMQNINFINKPVYNDYVETNKETSIFAKELIYK